MKGRGWFEEFGKGVGVRFWGSMVSDMKDLGFAIEFMVPGEVQICSLGV